MVGIHSGDQISVQENKKCSITSTEDFFELYGLNLFNENVYSLYYYVNLLVILLSFF